MPRPRLRLLLAALPLVAACGSREVVIAPEPPRPAVEVTEPTAPAPAPAPAPGGPTSPDQGLPPATNGVLPPGAADKILPVGAQPIVKLLEPGAEPRSDLSYALTKGSSQKLAMTMDTAMNVKVGGQGQPSTLPRMTMTFDNAAADRNAAGELSIESRLTGVSVDPAGGQQEQLANALRPQLEGMKGLGMLYWVNPKGRVHDVKMDIPKGMPPAAQQLLGGMSHSFESMVTPLPAEPVGVGAKWQVVSRASSGGADLLQAAIYTLKSRAGSRATLDVSMMQLAAKDSIHTPQMPANMSLKVVAFSSAGTGTTQVDLKSVAPEAGTMTLKASMTLAVPPQSPGAASDETSVDTTTTVQVARP